MGDLSRRILHIDMNAFYCACHAHREPEKYAGRATAVAGNPETRHGVVVTASYEARKVGVRATMTVGQALRACRDLILIAPDFSLYREYSRRAFALVRQYTPLVEIFSIDECFADITGCGIFGSPEEIATVVQNRMLQEVGLPCSIGISFNKLVAKMASDLKKPLGISTIYPSEIKDKLWPLPVRDLFGVGVKTAERLERLGYRTIGEIAQSDREVLYRWFGKRGWVLQELANGHDDSSVSPSREALKSIGHSITLARDVESLTELRAVMLNLSDQVGRRLRKHALCGRTVQITIRYADRRTVTRAHTLSIPIDGTEDIYVNAVDLLEENLEEDRGVRLLGVSVCHLASVQELTPRFIQLDLFSNDEPAHCRQNRKQRQLDAVTDRLRDKFGENIVIRGRMLQPHDSNAIRNRRKSGTSLQKDNLDE